MKLNYFIIISFSMVLSYTNLKNMSLEIKNMNLETLISESMTYLTSLDYNSKVFITMVSLVTFIILPYSSLYMEHYNNKKFFVLLMVFVISMMFLTLSNSWITMITSWDILGISSIFLVLFYPNETASMNAMLTMYMNRLGDVMMILGMSYFLMLFWKNPSMSPLNSMTLITIILLCAFTKSAQMPFSSWLPAAMSAPTPVSALVHSSTLVTAGIFIVLKLIDFKFMNSNIPLFISLITFVAGSMLAVIESDMKKIIAFSTMSQISMIIVTIMLQMKYLAMMHMMFHAIFKSTLFMAGGLMFFNSLGTQNYNNVKSMSSLHFSKMMLLLSCYMMSGLIMSSSFFSKDKILENLLMSNLSFMSIIMILASMLTITYCYKILKKLPELPNYKKTILSKKSSFKFTYIYLIAMMIPQILFYFKDNFEMGSLISKNEVFFMTLILISPLMFYIKISKIKIIFMKLPKSSMSSKFITFSQWKYTTNLKQMLLFYMNDNFFMKSNYLKPTKISMSKTLSKLIYLMIIIILTSII